METFAQEVAAEAQAARDAATNSSQAGESSDSATAGAADGGAQSSTGENNGTPPGTGQAQTTEQQQTVPRRALEDEREKRQLERQLREGLERRIAELEASVRSEKRGQQETPAVDYDKVFEDPASVFNAHAKVLENRLVGDRIHTSREMARAQLPDYDETLEKLAQLNVPGIEEAVAKSPAPAFTAYRMIKDYEREQQSRSQGSEKVKELESKLAEATAQLEALRSGGVPNLPSLSQSRGTSAGTQQPVKTTDSVLTAVWGKKLRKR